MGGVEYLQDLTLAEQPIAKDSTIVKAWAQEIFVHYSNVSRTLDASDEETLTAIIEVLQAISRPFIEAAVMETLKQEGKLTVDVDLVGREVSPTSTDYQDATFGWMDDEVAKGYQAAVTSLVCARWTRLLLTLLRYTGRTKSAECLQECVLAVEDLLGVRPRRQVELVQERRDAVAMSMERQQEALDRTQQGERQLWQRIREAKAEAQSLREEIESLEAEYQAQNQQERKHCHLAKARRKLDSAQKREQRAWRDLQKLQRRERQQQAKLDKQRDQLLGLDERLAYLEADNRDTPNPVPIVLRIDAGFSTGPNLAWLIEIGYIVLTKAHNGARPTVCWALSQPKPRGRRSGAMPRRSIWVIISITTAHTRSRPCWCATTCPMNCVTPSRSTMQTRLHPRCRLSLQATMPAKPSKLVSKKAKVCSP